MAWIAIVTVLLLGQLFAFAALVGSARARYGIKAPAMTGHEVFERTVRVHQNTLEQLVVVIPAMWVFGYYLSPPGGALLGLLFLVSRIVYYRAYVAHPPARGLGFGLGAGATLFLLIGALVGAVASLF